MARTGAAGCSLACEPGGQLRGQLPSSAELAAGGLSVADSFTIPANCE
jgi:hypothetical protein